MSYIAYRLGDWFKNFGESIGKYRVLRWLGGLLIMLGYKIRNKAFVVRRYVRHE
jgi:outer membrane phospholipase A